MADARRKPDPIARRIGSFVVVVAVVAIAIYVYLCWFLPGATVLLVRHADRLGSEDALSPAGVARAAELVHVGERAAITAIFQSEAQRTQRTAQDLAAAIGVTPETIPAADVQGLADRIRTQHRGHTVLVVGHSNTVPAIIDALGGPTLPDLAHDEYDELFVVHTCRCFWRTARATRLQYGAVSP